MKNSQKKAVVKASLAKKFEQRKLEFWEFGDAPIAAKTPRKAKEAKVSHFSPKAKIRGGKRRSRQLSN